MTPAPKLLPMPRRSAKDTDATFSAKQQAYQRSKAAYDTWAAAQAEPITAAPVLPTAEPEAFPPLVQELGDKMFAAMNSIGTTTVPEGERPPFVGIRARMEAEADNMPADAPEAPESAPDVPEELITNADAEAEDPDAAPVDTAWPYKPDTVALSGSPSVEGSDQAESASTTTGTGEQLGGEEELTARMNWVPDPVMAATSSSLPSVESIPSPEVVAEVTEADAAPSLSHAPEASALPDDSSFFGDNALEVGETAAEGSAETTTETPEAPAPVEAPTVPASPPAVSPYFDPRTIPVVEMVAFPDEKWNQFIRAIPQLAGQYLGGDTYNRLRPENPDGLIAQLIAVREGRAVLVPPSKPAAWDD